MRIVKIKQQLHGYVDSADAKKLKALYILLENDITKGYQFTENQKKELDKRYDDYMNGIGKTYTIDETIEIVE